MDQYRRSPAAHAAVFAFALGCGAINVGREAMMAIGCIHAQTCHTNQCPTGVATQHQWLVRGVDPTSKAVRLANYIVTLRKESPAFWVGATVARQATGRQSLVRSSRGHRMKVVRFTRLVSLSRHGEHRAMETP